MADAMISNTDDAAASTVRRPNPTLLRGIFEAIFGRDKRAMFFQLIFLAAALLVVVGLVETVSENLQRFNIGTGFAFLERPAGFEITQRLIPYTPASTYGRALGVALANTLALSVCVIVLGTIMGVSIGLVGLSDNRLASGMARGYIEIARNIPLLLHILFWYFAVLRPLPGPRQGLSLFDLFFLNNRGLSVPSPSFESGSWVLPCAIVVAIGWARYVHRRRVRGGRQLPLLWPFAAIVAVVGIASLTGVLHVVWDVPALAGFNVRGGALLLPEFVAMTVSLSCYSAAFIAEIVRSGIASVPKGQAEAARSLGFRSGAIYRLVVLPQALRVIIPPLTSTYVDVVKNSSLGAFIAYPELMLVFGGTVLNQTTQALEVMFIIIVVYLTINLSIAGLMGLYNHRSLLKER